MIYFLFSAAMGLSALLAWRVVWTAADRAATLRRRDRMTRSVAKQKAWDVVFGRRIQRHLSIAPYQAPKR